MTTDEQVFLDIPAAKVTSARVIIGNQTFAMSGITSVEVRKDLPQSKILPSSLMFVAGLATSIKFPIVGFAIAIGAIVMILAANSKKTKHHLFIRSSGGEANALTAEKPEQLQAIASAITDAIVFRG